MTLKKLNLTKACVILLVMLGLSISAIPAKAANPFDSLTNLFSGDKKKTTQKKPASQKALNPKAGLAATGCIAGAIMSKSQGGDAAQGCAQGVVTTVTEQDAHEEREMLTRKDSVAWGRRIDTVNERVIERQARIEKITADKKNDVPANPPEIVIDPKCNASASCRQAAIAAAAAAENPGIFTRFWHWVFPGSAPAAKEEIQGIESDIAILERSAKEIREEIKNKEDSMNAARDIRQKSDIGRDKGVLIFELAQANQTLVLLKGQRGQLDSGYFSYLLAMFTAVGAAMMKKFSDGATNKTLDTVKNLAIKARRRYKPELDKKHSMY